METKPERIPLEMNNPVHHAREERQPQAAAPSVDQPSLEQTSGPVDAQDLEEKIIAALKTCFDPEIPVNIYELGLIYGIDIEPSGDVELRMTLTSPACPA